MKPNPKSRKLYAAIAASAVAIATAAWAVPPGYQRIVAIDAFGLTTVVRGWAPAPTGVQWASLAPAISTAPSTQKTIGASVNRTVIMYRKADGFTRLVESGGPAPLSYGAPSFEEAGEVPVFADTDHTNIFNLVPEEIEVEPITNDVFALASAPNGYGPKQIYRIKKDPNGNEVATAMTFHNAIGVKTPNNNRAFVNPVQNGYKAGSIAFLPKSAGGHYLIFTHQSIYYGICHWIFDVKTGTKENELWSVTSNGTLTGIPLSKCQKSLPNSLTDFGTAIGGINTVYVGPPGGVPLTNGRFMLSRNNGPLYEVKGLIDPVPTSPAPVVSPWQVTPLSPSISSTASADYALVRNQWQANLPFP